MKLATFRIEDRVRIGVVAPGEHTLLELERPKTMLELIQGGESALRELSDWVAQGRGQWHELAAVELLAPLPRPAGNVIAIGRNYARHAEETARAWNKQPQPPTVFTKAITSLTEPYADIEVDPGISDQIDWEAEVAFVIGRRGVNIDRHDAQSYVFGYTVLNDVTARDIQAGWGGQYFKGKSLDRTCPTGPWIVTSDEIPDPGSLSIRLRINGQTKQEGNTADMIYGVRELIEWLSIGMTLLPGSLVASGTPDGVGFARQPPEFLRPGNVMETEVENIGMLRNRFVGRS